ARLVGKSKAIQLMIEAQNLTMEEAKTLGIVNDVLQGSEPEWWAQVLAYAQKFVPPGKASKAVGHIKRAVQSGLEMSFESGLTLERELQQRLFESEDAREGIAANLEKRKA